MNRFRGNFVILRRRPYTDSNTNRFRGNSVIFLENPGLQVTLFVKMLPSIYLYKLQTPLRSFGTEGWQPRPPQPLFAVNSIIDGRPSVHLYEKKIRFTSPMTMLNEFLFQRGYHRFWGYLTLAVTSPSEENSTLYQSTGSY